MADISCIVRNSAFEVSDQVHNKLISIVRGEGLKLEIWDLRRRGKLKTKALISSSLFSHLYIHVYVKIRFSHDAAHIVNSLAPLR